MTTTIYHISYASGPYTVKGYLGIPLNMTTPLPAVVYCRGGIKRVGKVKMDWVRAFAERGFVVFAPSYRGNEGGDGQDEFGGADCEDTSAAVRFLRFLPYVDSTRISIMGFSRGSINAFRTAILEPGIYRLVLWGGVSDLAATYEERPDLQRMLRKVLHGYPAQVPEAYRLRSAIYYAAAIPCQTLLVHGTTDVQVDIAHAYKLQEAFLQAGRSVETHFYEGYGHHLPEPVFDAAIDRWLDYLR